jgi:hypothetical protein
MSLIKKLSIVLGSALFLTSGTLLVWKLRMTKFDGETDTGIYVHPGSQPNNTDPLEFDSLVHHIFQRPLLSTLVSEHKVGGIMGVIAASWRSENNYHKWFFKIRTGMTFSSGAPITSRSIALSLNRMALLLNRRGSHDGLLEFLDGFQNVQRADELIDGISYSEDELVLRFSRPVENALHYLSFGQYAIVSPDDYNPQSGDWGSPNRVNSSGPYEIEKWDEEQITIKLRKDYPSLLVHPRPFHRLNFVWSAKFRDKLSIREGHEDFPLADKYSFLGSTKSSIRYVRILGFQNSLNPLRDKELRIRFRERLFSKLKSNGFPVTKSFLPLAIKGVRESIHSDKSDDTKFTGKLRIYKYPAFVPLYQRLPDLMAEAGQELGLETEFANPPPTEVKSSLNDPAKEPVVHLSVAGTSIIIERPKEDLRFMVKSKEGIRLPDPTGKLSKLVESQDYDVQSFNDLLDEDALVWPIMHTAGGIWVNPEIVDASLLNPEPPPTDLALLGRHE